MKKKPEISPVFFNVRSEIRRIVRKTPSLQLLAVGFAGILATFFIAAGIQSDAHQSAVYQLRSTAEEVLLDLDSTLQETIGTTLFLKSFFDASQTVTRQEFKLYTQALLEYRPFILALEWIPVVFEKSRREYEESIQREGYPGFQIQSIGKDLTVSPSKTKEIYFPISFAEPEKENVSLLGVDLGSEPSRFETFQKACKTGGIAISPLFGLLQNAGKQGFFVSAPLILEGQCQGFSLAVFKLEGITEKILRKQKNTQDFTFMITEESQETASDENDQAENLGASVVREIHFGDRVWRAEIKIKPELLIVKPGIKLWVALILGIGLTALLLLYLHLLMRYSEEVERTVFQRTQELEHTKTVLENEIEENLKTQQLLSKTERSYRQILDAITDMVLVKGSGSRILWANQAFCDYYGMNQEQLKNMIDAPFNLPDYTKQYVQDDEEVFHSGVPLDIPSEPVTRHDGEIGFFHTVKSPIIDKEGKVIQTVGVSRDISDRLHKEEKLQEITNYLKRSEEKFRSLVLNVPGAVYRCAMDSDWTMEFISESIQDLCGYPASEIIRNRKRTFASIMHPDDRDKVEKKVSESLKDKKPYTLEYRMNHADGSVRWVYEKGQAVFSESGEVSWLDGCIFDITERKNWEKQMQQAQKLDAVGKLAGGIAHDFNNQLMVISGYCTLILGEMPKESGMYPQMLDIKAAAEKSSYLTRQLLALGRKQIITPKIFEPNQALRNVSNMIQTLIGAQIDLRMELSDSLPSIRMDAQQFEQVLINLVMNARDAMPQGGKLTIRTSLETAKDSEIFDVIEIQDTGSGMSPEVRAHLFEPFFTTKDRAKGSGLGLATSYAMVQEANGRIEVKSELGQGTLFRIFFPTVKKEEDPKPLPAEVKSESKNSGRILLVDDEASVRGVVAAILKARGYMILEAGSGEEALSAAEKEACPMDLLITDIMMPGMDGLELVRRFQRKFPETATLFISGYADKFSSEEFKETPLLEKPFNPEVLTQKVLEILEAHKIKKDLFQKIPDASKR